MLRRVVRPLLRPRLFSSATRDYEKGRIRNLGIIAHVDAGKTTTVERMLHYAGVTKSIGDVDKGNTVTDYLEMERERGITIVSAAISFEWRDHRINLVDTPGHVDFTIEVERSVRAVDGAVAILDAVAGVQAQTETVWLQANRYSVPRIAFVNKYDREGASVVNTASMMKDRLGATVLPVQWPLGVGIGFRGVVDLLRMELLDWLDESGKEMRSRKLDPSMPEFEEVRNARSRLFEQLCEVDEEFFERYISELEQNENPEKMFLNDLPFVNTCIRRATLALKAVPLFVGASFRNKGVQPLLDGILMYLPSPMDRWQATDEGTLLKPDDKGPLVCMAWKVVHNHQMGLITYFRVVSGTFASGKLLLDVNTGKKERPSRIVQLMGGDMLQVAQITSGNIGALIGLKSVSTGDTLVSPDVKDPVRLKGVRIPPPVFFRSIEPMSVGELQKLEDALAMLAREDPSFFVYVHPDTNQTLIGGMGELHLEYLLDRLKSHYAMEFVVGDIMIAYRCASRSEFEEVVELSHEHSFPGSGKTIGVRVKLSVSSKSLIQAALCPRVEDGRTIEWGGVGAFTSVDRKALAAIQDGVVAACNRGNELGHPVVGVSVSVLSWGMDGEPSGDEWSNVLKLCSEKAVRSVWDFDNFAILEPGMKVEVRAEEGPFGAVMGDLAVRKGIVLSVAQGEGKEKVASALVPLKEMIGYARWFRTTTAGKGSFSMEFSRYLESERFHEEPDDE